MGIRSSLRKKLIKRKIKIPYFLMNKQEKYFHRVFAKISSHDVIIDLGAHLGKFTAEFAKRARTVYAFEPHPDIFASLQKNTCRFSNVVAYQKAISDEDGEATLYSDPSQTSRPTEGSTLSNQKRDVSYENGFSVETVQLSKFIQDLHLQVKLIKIDIEGMEYNVINDLLNSGAIDLVDLVYVEDHCQYVDGLELQREQTLEEIRKRKLEHKFDFNWP